jgi:hypothetical protein
LRKESLEIIFRRAEREIPNIEFHRHNFVPVPYGMLREASNQVCFRETVAAKALDRTFKKRTASEVKFSLLSNYP